MQKLGHILFILGIIIAVVAGIGFEHPWLPVGLAVFGVFVGLVNVVDNDTNKFLITGIALEVSASAFRQFSFIGEAMSDVMIFLGGRLIVEKKKVLFSTALGTLWKRRAKRTRSGCKLSHPGALCRLENFQVWSCS